MLLRPVISAYVREKPGVRDVANAQFAVEGRRFSWPCEVLAEERMAAMVYDSEG